MSTAEKVKNIVVEQLGVDEDEVTLDANLLDDLGADSLDSVELVMALEEEFGIEISDDEWEGPQGDFLIKTVGDAIALVERKRKLQEKGKGRTR